MWVDPEGNGFVDEGITLKQHMKNFMENNSNLRKLWQGLHKNTIDFDKDYNVKCLNCGRMVYCGKCCDTHMSQAMLDKENGIEK